MRKIILAMGYALRIFRVSANYNTMKTFKLGTGHFSIWHHGSSLYASGVFDHQSEAKQCAKKLESNYAIACDVKETAAGWNIKGKGSK